MTNTSDPQTNSSDFVLNEVIDITVINKFYDDLKNLLVEGSTVVIDAKDVKRLDTSAIQLICCWYVDAISKEIDVKWKNIDGIFLNSARLLGVSELLSIE